MDQFVVILDREAEADLASIQQFVEQASGRRAAADLIRRILAYCRGLDTAPHRGTRHDHILTGLRIVGWKRTATIAFRVDDTAKQVSILGVFYRGRDVTEAIGSRLHPGEE